MKLLDIIDKFETYTRNADKSRFGRSVDDYVSLGAGFTGGLMTGLTGDTNYASFTWGGMVGYTLNSGTNTYGATRNGVYSTFAFSIGYVIGQSLNKN